MQNNIPKADSREGELSAIKSKILEESRRLEPQDSFNAAIRSAIPDDGILVAGMTQLGYYSRAYYPVYWPGTYLNSSYFGNLGFAFPVALGAKVAQPERSVVAISGDGGFLYNSQELATAVKYGINVVTVVFNDNAYGNVLRDQQNRFEGRTLGAELHNPDFVKLAEAYGIKGMRVKDQNQLSEAIIEANNHNGPVIIDFVIEKVDYVYPMIPAGQSVDQLIEDNMSK
jgi:acetolactate synthase-1/2/3 large subunit